MIPVAGIRAIGPSSMMYIASKYAVISNSIKFFPFIKDVELTGRARYSEKGILSFDIKNSTSNNPLVTIISTHLQHSEIPGDPTQEEKAARTLQMQRVANLINTMIAQQKRVIFTGDLNQGEKELSASLDRCRIQFLKRDLSIQGKPTWGGDVWCAKLMKKTASSPSVLDYTFVGGKGISISTKIIDSSFSEERFDSKALSDHHLLFSTISLD